MLATRSSVVLASAIACLLASACTGETQERPLRSAADEAPRAAPVLVPFPDSAFRSDDDPRQPGSRAAPPSASRFETRRIGEQQAPAKRYRGATVDLDLKNADLANVFRLLADVGHVNIVIAGELGAGTVTMRLRHVPWDQALDVIARARGLVLERDGNVIVVRAGA